MSDSFWRWGLAYGGGWCFKPRCFSPAHRPPRMLGLARFRFVQLCYSRARVIWLEHGQIGTFRSCVWVASIKRLVLPWFSHHLELVCLFPGAAICLVTCFCISCPHLTTTLMRTMRLHVTLLRLLRGALALWMLRNIWRIVVFARPSNLNYLRLS